MRTIIKMSNLSLLSRGTGQVVRKKQEKLEVHFDPEDYLNWKSPETRCHVSRLPDTSQVVEGFWRLCLPKTYSTRTGALVLYSEDLAKPSLKLKECRKSQRRLRNKSRMLHIELHTLQDLARAILAYGGKQLWKDKKRMAWQPYLHFLSDPDIQTERQMRPGYSAKRYLLKLSQTWDPSILQKLQCAGYIKDPLLLEENSPDHRKKLQDLSAAPPKYNLLHIFCSPCPYLQTELEEQTNPVHGPSFHKQPENKARMVEDYEEGENAKGKTRIPLTISVRKLSFHLRPQHTKETTWSQNTAHIRIPEDRWVGVHQDGKTAKEDPGHSEIQNQIEDYPPLRNINIETSEHWCEKSHVTFYGGFFPGRKISYSVNQRHLKNAEGKERGPSVGTGLFPPIQPGTSSERGGVMKEHREREPEIFRLPQISKDSPRAHRKKIKSGVYCYEPSEVDVCDEQLAPLPNDLILEPEHRRNKEQQQMINGGISEASHGSFCLPPINNGQFTLNGKKREVRAEKVSKSQTECHNDTSLSSLRMDPDREIICPSFLGSIQTTDVPEQFGFIPDEEEDGEVSLETRRNISINPPEIISEGQKRDEKESPGIQRTKLSRPRDERHRAVKKEAIQLVATPKNGGSALCTDKRLGPPEMQQAGKLQGNRNGFETVQNTRGSESISAESRKESWQDQDGFSRSSHLQLSKEVEGPPTLPQTQSAKQKNFIQDTGKQLDNLSPSSSLSHLEPHLAHSMIAASEMVVGSESESAAIDLLEHGEEIKEGPRRAAPSSAKQFGTEEETAMLSEATNKQAQATSLNRAGGVLENKSMSRQKKHELVKTGAASKAQKKSPKKDKRQSRTEFVVGKPRQKKAVGEKATSSKEKPAGVKRSEQNQEEEKEGGDVELEQIGSLVEGGGEGGGEDDNEKEDLRGTSDQSVGPSTPLEEEQPSLLEEGHPFAEEAGRTSGSPAEPASEIPLDSRPAVSTANGSPTDAVQSSGLPEDFPVNREEEKLSRDKMIADRAEKRRLAVERKRREQEGQKRKEQQQQERMERMKEEMEQEQQRRIEEMRLRRQQQEEERQHQEEEAARKQHAEKASQERVRQQQEEHRRKLLEMQKKKQQEEQERAEAEKRKQKEREIWLEEERQRLAEMAEEQRLEYEKREWEEEEKAMHEAEERRKRDEEEARIAFEEARKQASSLARQRAELEKQHQFQYQLLAEASGLERGQEISRPWVYSYFQHPFLKVGDDD